jgi:hypothetical protein
MMILHVETPFADGLMNDLPNAGLIGERVSENVVRVTSPLPEDTDESIAFELGWYADRFGITRMWSEEVATAQGDS